MAYFNEGMNPAAAMKFNKDCLEMAVDFTEQHLADGSKNPLPRSVYWWHDQWRMENLGKYIHIYIYMLHVHQYYIYTVSLINTLCPIKKRATLFFNITSIFAGIFSHLLRHFVQKCCLLNACNWFNVYVQLTFCALCQVGEFCNRFINHEHNQWHSLPNFFVWGNHFLNKML